MVVVVVITAIMGGMVTPQAARAEQWAPPQTVFVARTGHTVDGLFLDAWQSARALLGDPITEEVAQGSGDGADEAAGSVVQYFENAALVYFPSEPYGEQVRALDLGRRSLERAMRERPSPALVAASKRTACAAAAECRGFSATGHTVDAGFRTFWETSGEERLIGEPLTEAFRGPDGTWLQYFERAVLGARVGEGIDPMPLGVAAANRERVSTERVRRPIQVPIYAASLFVEPLLPAIEAAETPLDEETMTPELVPDLTELPVEGFEEAPVEVLEPAPVEVIGPGAQQGAYQEIVVSVSAQTMWAYEGGTLVNSSLVSTGTAEVPETTTPVGSHAILSKIDVQTMEGTISGDYYRVEDVPYVMYFDNLGNALHGTYWHANFGAPMSHGCVNLPMDVAAWVYGWASVGTAVSVIA